MRFRELHRSAEGNIVYVFLPLGRSDPLWNRGTVVWGAQGVYTCWIGGRIQRCLFGDESVSDPPVDWALRVLYVKGRM